MIILKTPSEIEVMRQGGKILAQVLDEVIKKVEPGVNSLELDQYAEKLILEKGGIPSFKGYGDQSNPFPATLCVSINEEVVHGIPGGGKNIKDKDVVSLDIGMEYPARGGMFTDMARTIGVGNIDKKTKKLIKTTRRALEAGIKQCKSGNLLSQVSEAIQTTAESQGFSVVKTLVGHGVGKAVHEDPQIPNYVVNGPDIVLKTGMTLALEPMLNMGDYQVELLDDGWTFVTKDRSLSAHFENTVLVKEEEPEIITGL